MVVLLIISWTSATCLKTEKKQFDRNGYYDTNLRKV